LHHRAKLPKLKGRELAAPHATGKSGANACDGDKQTAEAMEAGLNVMGNVAMPNVESKGRETAQLLKRPA